MSLDGACIFNRSSPGDCLQPIPGCQKTSRFLSKHLGKCEGFLSIHAYSLLGVALSNDIQARISQLFLATKLCFVVFGRVVFVLQIFFECYNGPKVVGRGDLFFNIYSPRNQPIATFLAGIAVISANKKAEPLVLLFLWMEVERRVQNF